MSENLNPKFEAPGEEIEEVYRIERPGGIDDDVLSQKIGKRTFRSIINESYGKKGWLLAAGAVVVVPAGIKYFKKKHPKEYDGDDI